MTDFRHESISEQLSGLLQGDLPGQPAQFQMAPVHRRKETGASVENRDCSEAAVLALLYPDRGGDDPEAPLESHILLTVRPSGMARHAGQVALPGGRRECDETLERTALRETHEEVYIDPSDVRLVGRLSPLFVTPSRFCVHPFVGIVDAKPDLGVTSEEVARVFGAPLAELTRPETRKTAPRQIRGRRMIIPYFDLEGQFVWGATAMMLSELAALLNPSLLASDPLDGVLEDESNAAVGE
jgi:8-oxo-dGTP pyrophosphatase MutT (NUDIX family)